MGRESLNDRGSQKPLKEKMNTKKATMVRGGEARSDAQVVLKQVRKIQIWNLQFRETGPGEWHWERGHSHVILADGTGTRGPGEESLYVISLELLHLLADCCALGFPPNVHT